ncbi:MAG: BON domain-containing protein [Pirellulales bacterium]|nr:BON domain-containing protein [Pirellulales bacterium]
MLDSIDAVLPEPPLWERVHEALRSSPYISESQVHFAAKRGEITLHGNVNSYYQKQMAQETVRRIDGVQQIENLLEVNWNRETVSEA